VIADDQPLLRTGFKALIEPEPDLEAVGEAGDGREAVRLAKAAQADVVLMDIRMPVLDGLAATRLITADEDLAGVKVLILTTFEIDEYVFEALRAGASGFLGKSAQADELLQAIRTVSRGDALLSPVATRTLISRFLATEVAPPQTDETILRGLQALTEREREIAALVATGLSNDQIAARLVLSPATIKTHVNRAMVKVGARDRAQLVVFAYHSGLADARTGGPRGTSKRSTALLAPEIPGRGRRLQGIARGGDVAAVRGGEEVEVFGGPCRQLLRQQGRSPGQQKAVAGGQREEQPGDLQLEGRQRRLAVACRHHAASPRDGEITGSHGTGPPAGGPDHPTSPPAARHRRT